MPVIQIKESSSEEQHVVIRVEGILNQDTLATFKEVCLRHLNENKNIVLNLKGLLHASREAMVFLKSLKNRVTIEDAPLYMGLHEGKDRMGNNKTFSKKEEK